MMTVCWIEYCAFFLEVEEYVGDTGIAWVDGALFNIDWVLDG
jgi:hypothetical protein